MTSAESPLVRTQKKMTELALRQYDAPADRIRLHLQSSRARVLIVEGVTDAEVLGDILAGRSVFPVGSRGIVLQTAAELMTLGTMAFIAVIDLDFTPPPSGVDWDFVLHPYEERDLESMLIRLGALHRLLRYKGSSSKIALYGGIDALVGQLLEVVRPITRLRFENARRSLGLCFDAVRLEDKIDAKTLELRLDSYCAALAAASEVPAAPLKAIAAEEVTDVGAPRGKDVIAAASVALRRVGGSLPKAACEPEILGADLLAASSLLLRDSQWFSTLRKRLE